ncbi:MAG: sugar phosphate isomerase/epimerase [Peptococcaceae bacterium]|nr:sugar phosphate isomerase/epimerase [Peptococcaceae bacterium]
MKFGFSTLGCPGWPWGEIITSAADLGYDGIELRGIGSEMYLPHVKEFARDNLPHIHSRLKKMGLTIPCLTTGAFLFDPERKESAREEVIAYLELAADMKAPYIRVLGDANPQPGQVDEDLLEENLAFLLPLAAERNVVLLLETNGVYASSPRIITLMKKVNHPNLGLLWDIHHPYRFFQEPVAETYNTLKPWIKHVHVKDSVVSQGKIQYCMLGYGDVPVAEAVSLLAADNFSGFVVLEWVKRWNMDLEEPGIVFSHYLSTIKRMLT